MLLKNLKFQNFRLFDELEVQFHDKLTVLVGANGSGKTAVIEGAAIALGTFFTGLDGISPGIAIKKTDARLKNYSIGNTTDVQSQYPVEISAFGKVDGFDVEWERTLNRSNGSVTIKGAKSLIDIVKKIQSRLRSGDTGVVLPILAYYGTCRLWDYHRQKKSDSFSKTVRTNGYIDSLDGTANVKLMLNWLHKQLFKKTDGGNRPQDCDVVFKTASDFFERSTGFSDCTFHYDPDTNEIVVRYKDDAEAINEISLNQLSDGYKSSVSLIIDIAYRMTNLNPHFGDDAVKLTPGIVLIDEIDLHLHPSWQQRILGDLQALFPKVQFIVSTHAPAVIHSIKSENLRILGADGLFEEPSGQVFGKDVNTIVDGVMGAKRRPKEILDSFNEIYQALDAKDLKRSEELLNNLELQIGTNDSEIVACHVKVSLLKFKLERRNDRNC